MFDEDVRLLRLPYWTEVVVPETIRSIDRLLVRIDSYVGVGVGAGLNEVRLRKR